ncbi:hypothetical protein TWF481_002821 [Arthrobotrys musiformis]|uniref:Uncharacterized protein n=1 Tax=Arthrobotrys musiformis TaxID=47236 RepID=A0AAV9VXG5_9PEZI
MLDTLLDWIASIFGSKKGDANTSILPTPNSNMDQRNGTKFASGHDIGHQDYMPGGGLQIYGHSAVALRPNGSFSNMYGQGSSSRENYGLIHFELVDQFESSLNTIRGVYEHLGKQVRHFENNYQDVLKERNTVETENRKLGIKVKDLKVEVAALKSELNTNVAQLRELQADHLRTPSSRKLPPSSSTISNEFEDLERMIKHNVFMRLARLNIEGPYIKALSQHQPFLEAAKAIMADNVTFSGLEVVGEPERMGSFLWLVQGVIHDVLYEKIMKIHMLGLNVNELQVMKKILDVITLSEKCQGIRSAHEWRADTYRRLAYWAENVKELEKYIEDSPAIGEIRQTFDDLIGGTKEAIRRIFKPLCDESPEGKGFSLFIAKIVDRAFQFNILIGSQTARYELHRDVGKTDNFKFVPDHLNESTDAANNWAVPLFYIIPALVKTSSEDGEVYDVPELLVDGKIYALSLSSDSAKEEKVPPDVAGNTIIQPASTSDSEDLENKDTEAITNVEMSQGAVARAQNEIAPGPKSLTTDSNIKPEPIVISTCKSMKGSRNQTPKGEPNGVTIPTASTSNENNTPEKTFNMASQLSSGGKDAEHQEKSTKADQAIAGPGSLQLQSQAAQKSLKEPLGGLHSSEDSLSSERSFQNLEAHPTEIQASSIMPNTPLITEAALLQQETLAAIPQSQSLFRAVVETESAPPRMQPQHLATPASHTILAASEVEKTSYPQVPFGIQPQPLLELPTPSISQNHDLTSQGESEHWQLGSEPTNSDSEASTIHPPHQRRANEAKKQRRGKKRSNRGKNRRRKGSRH